MIDEGRLTAVFNDAVALSEEFGGDDGYLRVLTHRGIDRTELAALLIERCETYGVTEKQVPLFVRGFLEGLIIGLGVTNV